MAFVVSLNLHRRHLSESQRAEIADWIRNLKKGDNRFTIDPAIAVSTEQAAQLLNVSKDSIERAAKMQQELERHPRRRRPRLPPHRRNKMRVSLAVRMISSRRLKKSSNYQWNHDLLTELARLARQRIVFQHWFLPCDPDGSTRRITISSCRACMCGSPGPTLGAPN